MMRLMRCCAAVLLQVVAIVISQRTNQTCRQDFCDICDVIHRPEGVSAKSQQKYFIVGISTLVSRNIGRHLLKRKVDLQFLMEK